MRIAKSAVAFVVVTTLCSCGDGAQTRPSDATPVIDTVGSTVVVTNRETGQWGEGGEWQLREEWRVGEPPYSEEGENLLFRNALLGVSLGPKGQVCVLDFPGDALACLDGDGENPRVLASRGHGPGELSEPAGMGWDLHARLWIAEWGGRYSVFDSAGRFLKTVPRPIYGGPRRQYPLVFEGSGTLVDEAVPRDGIQFLRIDQTGEIVDRLAVLHPSLIELPRVDPRRISDAYQYVTNHYVPHTEWAVAPDGTAWLARTDRLELYKIDLETGDTLRVVRTVHRPAELTSDDEERIGEGLAEVGIHRGSLDLTRPVLQAIHLTSDGYVLVQIVEEIGTSGRSFDVFAPDGAYLGALRMPFALSEHSQPSFVGDTILGVTTGEFDEPYVIRATLTRSP